jgi:hypothetical protein
MYCWGVILFQPLRPLSSDLLSLDPLSLSSKFSYVVFNLQLNLMLV